MSTLEEIATELNSAVTHFSRAIRAIDDRQPVGRAPLSALAVLVFGGPRSLTELADSEGVTPVTMHHTVRRLIAEGYAKQKQNPNDARSVIVEVTAKGRRTMMKARQDRLDWMLGNLSGLTEQEAALLRRTAAVLNSWAGF